MVDGSIVHGMIMHSFVSSGLFVILGKSNEECGSRSVRERVGLGVGYSVQLLVLVLCNGGYPCTGLYLTEVLCYYGVMWSMSGACVGV